MKEKLQNFSRFFISLITKVIIIGIIGLILYSIGKSVWKNYQVVQKIDSVQNEITAQEDANKNLQNLIIYYQTDSFRELEARRKLGYKKPGENVLIIPELSNNIDVNTEVIKNQKEKEQTPEEPNFIKWYHYIFHR